MKAIAINLLKLIIIICYKIDKIYNYLFLFCKAYFVGKNTNDFDFGPVISKCIFEFF